MKINKSPKVTVVMSVYNGAEGLTETIDSILNQKNIGLEFIIVNDGSTDGTLQILQRYAVKDNRLKVIDQENRGLTHSLILGCAEAKGEFIARQDVGDISLKGRLARQAELLQHNQTVVLVGSDYSLVTADGEIIRDRQPKMDSVAMMEALRGEGEGLYGPHHGTVMFRKSAYELAGGYRDSFYFAQDLDLWTRLVECGELSLVPDVTCQIQFSTNSLSGRFRDEQQQLKLLIGEAASLRKKNLSEESVLEQAGRIRPNSLRETKHLGKTEAAAAYFIGSCLSKRGNPAALRYYRQAIGVNPFHLKAWLKLIKGKFQGLSGA